MQASSSSDNNTRKEVIGTTYDSKIGGNSVIGMMNQDQEAFLTLNISEEERREGVFIVKGHTVQGIVVWKRI